MKDLRTKIDEVLKSICGCKGWELSATESKREHEKSIDNILFLFSQSQQELCDRFEKEVIGEDIKQVNDIKPKYYAKERATRIEAMNILRSDQRTKLAQIRKEI